MHRQTVADARIYPGASNVPLQLKLKSNLAQFDELNHAIAETLSLEDAFSCG
jgi:hypothetical protein